MEELFRHLDGSKKLFGADGDFRPSVDLTPSDVPRSVRLITENRLGQISDACRRILSIAAVKGRTVDYSTLKELSDLSEEQLFDALEEAEQAFLLQDASVGREATYAFVHELIRNTLLNSLSLPRRQKIHLQLADVMERSPASDDKDPAEIAFHLYMAGSAANRERTLRFLLLASERALAAVAFEDALELLTMVTDTVPERERETRARVAELRGIALRGTGRIDEALSALQAGIDLGEDSRHFAQLLFQRARLLVDLYRAEESLSDLHQLLQISRSDKDGALELATQRLLADAHYRISLDNPDHAHLALEACERTIDVARLQKDQRALASALILSADFADFWLDYQPTAQVNLNEATALAESLGDENLLLDCATMKLRVAMVTPLEFGVQAEEVLERLEAHRDPIRLKEHLFCMIHPARNAGRLERSIELCDRASKIAGHLGVPPVQYPTLKGLALIAMGRLGEAWRSIEQEVTGPRYRFSAALQRYGFLRFRAEVGDVRGVLAEVGPLLTECRALNRVWMLESIADVLATTGSRFEQPEQAMAILNKVEPQVRLGTQATAELALARGDVENALSTARDVATACRENGTHLLAADADDLAVRCLLRLERWEDALTIAGEQIDFCRSVGYLMLLWRLLAERAQALTSVGESELACRDYESACELLNLLGPSLSDLKLRQIFLNQPLARHVVEQNEAGA